MAIELNLPSQIKKYLSVAFFPATGNDFTLYIANDTNRLYQWDGAAYVELSQQDAVNWGSIGGDIINQTDLQLALSGKVNIEAGKGLSTNDYTTAEKNKLAGIESGAQVNDVDSVNGQIGAVVLGKSDVGLSNVDNTSDANKPISTATQTALNAKQNTLTLTTTGSSGASTLVGSTLNVPNYTLSGLGGVSTSRTLTINGVTQDLSANRTFTISTGITIGSTAITSGVVGRVLFEGAGNVVQESSSLFWDATNNRLGIGTSTPAQTLDARGGFNLYSSGVSPNGYYLEATSSTTTDGTLNFQRVIGGTGTTRLTFQGLEINTNTNSGINQLLATSGQSWAILTNGSEKMRVLTNGNVLIGTTTDAGYKLDVNGTARVQGGLTVTTNVVANTASSGTGYEGYKIQDGANARFVAERLISNFLGIGHNSVSGRWDDVLLGSAQRLYFYTGASERMRIFSTGNIGINTTTDAGFRLDVNGTARVQGAFSALNTSSQGIMLRNDYGSTPSIEFWDAVLRASITRETNSGLTISGGGFAMHTVGAGTLIGGTNRFDLLSSAQLQVNSTTKGFLPPRMTTTQKNAIATPAAGLMVYDTTLNVISYYNGSMWI